MYCIIQETNVLANSFSVKNEDEKFMQRYYKINFFFFRKIYEIFARKHHKSTYAHKSKITEYYSAGTKSHA